MDIQIRTNKQWNGISNINHNKDVVGSFSTAWYKNLTKPAGRSLNITMMTLMCKFILDLKKGGFPVNVALYSHYGSNPIRPLIMQTKLRGLLYVMMFPSIF